MNTKWYLYILWSVFSLDLRQCSAVDDGSPSGASRRGETEEPSANGTGSTAGPNGQADPRPAAQRPGRYLEPRSPPDTALVPDVSVSCSTSDFVVRVKANFYGLGANSDELRLGTTCRSNGRLGAYGDLLFTYRIPECDVTRATPPGYIAYKYVLRYTPSASRRAEDGPGSFGVQLECRYPRYHQVYQLAVRPTWHTAIYHKHLTGHRNQFQIQLMDATWTVPAESQVYELGQTVNVQVSASHLPPGGKVYARSCFATPYNDHEPPILYPLIDNFGCMLMSKTDLGAWMVCAPDHQTLRFSFSAFQFTADPNAQVQIQCKFHVSSEGPNAVYKACNHKDNKWRALIGGDHICDCCESQCVTSKSKRAMVEGSAKSEPILVSDQPVTPVEHFPLATPPLISTPAEAELEEVFASETGMNQPATEQGSLVTPSHLSITSDKEDQPSSTTASSSSEDSAEDGEVEKELKGDASVWVEGAKAVGRLNKLGIGSGLITKQWEGDLVELGEGEVLRVQEGKEPELRSTHSSETKQTVAEDKAHKVSGERLGEEEVVTSVTVAQRVTSAAVEQSTTHWAGRERMEQPPVGGGKVEEGGGTTTATTGRHGGRSGEIEWQSDKAAPGDGLVDGGDKEMTWYFTWR